MRLGIKAYARHRKDRGLPGATPPAVRKALERGQIRRGLDEMIDVAEADRDWPGEESPTSGAGGGTKQPTAAAAAPTSSADAPAVHVELEQQPHGGALKRSRLDDAIEDGEADRENGSEYGRARARKETALARLRELEVAQLEETLIPMDVHEDRVQLLCESLASRVKNLGRYIGDVQRAMSDLEAAELLERITDELLASLLEIAGEMEDSEEEDLDTAA